MALADDIEIQDGLLTLYLMNLLLIRVPDYMETEKQDKEMVERWKNEADSILVFVCAGSTIICTNLNNMFKSGLFTAVGTVSIVESYKWLSPDSGDETVELLAQLINVTQKIPLTPGSSQPFQRTFDVVAVNVFWFASIAICMVCAVLATLIQQWARRYLALSQGRGTPEERARVRGFLYTGLRRFHFSRVCQLLSMSLHISIGLYGHGIVIFVFHVDPDLVVLALLAFSPIPPIYTTLTFLPIFFLNSPYCTPFSAPAWRIWHFGWAVFFWIISGIANLLSFLLPNGFVNFLQNRAEMHRQRCADGLKRSVERYAKGIHD